MNKHMIKKPSKKAKAAIAGGLALTLIIGSLAYFTSNSKIENPLETGKYGTKTIEEFTPSQKIEPGATITKKVEAKNTGDYGLVVRVRLDEEWKRNDASFKTILSKDAIDTVEHKAAEGTELESWIAKQGDGSEGAAKDGDVKDDESVMYKNLPGLTGDTWVKGNDGYFYYKTILGAGQTTTKLLESLTLASNVDLGVYNSTECYSTVDKDVVEAAITDYETAEKAYKDILDKQVATEAEKTAAKKDLDDKQAALDTAYAWQSLTDTDKLPEDGSVTYRKTDTSLFDDAKGYADADYTLTVTTEVCQATSEAVQSEWAMDKSDSLKAINVAWDLPSNK